jgi:hypothetical protein
MNLSAPSVQNDYFASTLTCDRFGDAVFGLIKASLVMRSPTQEALSVHRMVQFAVFTRLPKEERVFYLGTAISLLYHGFPNTWNKTGLQQGHGWAAWETCSSVLPHVSWLTGLTEKNKLGATNTDLFAELIFRSITRA